MNLLPRVKKLQIKDGFLKNSAVAPYCEEIDYRIKNAINCLPVSQNGAALVIKTKGEKGEKYTIDINQNSIEISADGLNGVFYAIQTLRQVFKEEKIPCAHIEDWPDFDYRGHYHDITRGKIPTLESLKELVDILVQFKINSLQLYVEHVYEFNETKELVKKTGYITKEELIELDKYCLDNFIEFVPSIATFGHMYEILEQEQYKHLRVLKDFKTPHNFWVARMQHHTIDPENPQSLELVKSLISQYYPNFKSDKFNICGDETFDLDSTFGEAAGDIYVKFIKEVANFVTSQGKKVMMWADIVLQHPETIKDLPDDIYFLNWNYWKNPPESVVAKFAETGKKQIVCPGVCNWSRFCENLDCGQSNIEKLIDLGHKYGAVGVLNTSWGDYANPASTELYLQGMVLGAAKSWAVETQTNDEYYELLNKLVYGSSNAVKYLTKLSEIHTKFGETWNLFCNTYFKVRYGEEYKANFTIDAQTIKEIQAECGEIINDLSAQKWGYDEVREEAIICAKALVVLAQLGGKMVGVNAEKTIQTADFIKEYEQKWLQKNKPSELNKISEMLLYLENM